jgi:acyl-CoA reductase-like NAD-dependent aldehyde dehydrogenase
VCGRNLIPCTLELGGKDPMIVCADADLERAARGAVYGAFTNSGQVCTSTERVYVVDDIADAFTRKVVEETGRLRQGATGEFEVGAIIDAKQLGIIEEHVRDAVAGGARVLAGGRRNPSCPGLFYEPTVLVDVTHDMKVMRDETFGPVLPIMRVRDEDEALALANDSPYGLNANVWTKSKRKGTQIAREIESGCVVVNDCMLTYGVTESPFGGVKQSGIGRVNGELGLQGYCRVQSILVDRFGGKTEPLWYPYSARKLRLLRRALRLIWGTSFGRLLS